MVNHFVYLLYFLPFNQIQYKWDIMKTPSIAKLKLVFGDNAKRAKEIFKIKATELLETPAGKARYQECYNPPPTYDLRLHALNALDNGLYGVESCESLDGEFADYLNTGDSYNPTVIYWRGNYRVQSVGDFVEIMQRQGVKFK